MTDYNRLPNKSHSRFKGGKFLKKLCRLLPRWGVLQDNFVLSTGLIIWIGHRKEIRKLTFRALALRVVYIQKDGAKLWVGAWQREKQQNKLVEWKVFVATVRSKSADLWSRVLRLSVLPFCIKKPHTTHNSSILSYVGLTLETSAFESLQSVQFTLLTQLIKPNYLVVQDLTLLMSSSSSWHNSHCNIYLLMRFCCFVNQMISFFILITYLTMLVRR